MAIAEGNALLDYIPQRSPIVMVEKLHLCDEKKAQTTLTVTEENIFVEDGVLSEAGLTENIAQTAATRAGFESSQAGKPAPIGFIGGIKDLKILRRPTVGTEIKTTIEIVKEVFGVTLVQGQVHDDQGLCASCEMKIVIFAE